MALPSLLSSDDLVKFRTRFCERFLQFGECNFGGKCQYSHNMAWRRRSPQKYLYEPRLCENIISYSCGGERRRHSVLNCHNGKNCKFAHSREEVLYHPLIYKTVMCEDPLHCVRYYCPFGHSPEELLPSHESLDYIKNCLMDVILDQDENDSDNDIMGSSGGIGSNLQSGGPNANQNGMYDHTPGDEYGNENPSPAAFGSLNNLRMRKASGSVALNGGLSLLRPNLPIPGSTEYNMLDPSNWVTVLPSLRIETIVRASSIVVGSELCRAMISRDGSSLPSMVSNGMSSHHKRMLLSSCNGGNSFIQSAMVSASSIGGQMCLAKVMRFDTSAGDGSLISSLVSELNVLAKSEHKNLLPIKKVYYGKLPGAQNVSPNAQQIISPYHTMLCVVFEQCSTSLLQGISEGYKMTPGADCAATTVVGSPIPASVKGLAKKLNPHNGTTPASAILRIQDLVAGVQRLHFIGIAHLRLSPSNVLIDNEAVFKFGDFMGKFGILKNLLSRASNTSQLDNSVLVWQPAEVIVQLSGGSIDPPVFVAENGSFNLEKLKRVDVFSLGCCVFFAMTGHHPYGGGPVGSMLSAAASGNPSPFAPLVENILSDYVSNQHLLYNCPLVLDFCFRTFAADPADRMEIQELSRHPLFWDFEYARNFLTTLIGTSVGTSHQIFRDFVSHELLGWKEFVASIGGNGISSSELIRDSLSYGQTILGCCEFLVFVWKKINSPFAASVWIRTLERFPQILVRFWDGARVLLGGGSKTVNDSSTDITAGGRLHPVFKRHHLHWMSLRSGAVTSVSHGFAREYYWFVTKRDRMVELENSAVASSRSLSFPDESAVLSEACAQLCISVQPPRVNPSNYFANPTAGFNITQSLPRASPPMTPVVSSAWAGGFSGANTPPGMKFVDPFLVKQMAAASAALSAIYDNPDLVNAINKTDKSNRVTPYDQLTAAGTIYASLLEGTNGAANGANQNHSPCLKSHW